MGRSDSWERSMTQTSKYVEQSKPISGPAEPSATPGLRTNGQATLRSLHEALQACVSAISRYASLAGARVAETKIADAFNEIVAANEVLAMQLEAVGQVVGREAGPASAFSSAFRTVPGRDGNVDQCPDGRFALADHRCRARSLRS